VQWCPVCLALQGKRVRLSCVHVLLSCSGVQAVRDKTGITEFITGCKEGGLSSLASYSAFLNSPEVKEYFEIFPWTHYSIQFINCSKEVNLLRSISRSSLS
jgi:hypothetical protein